MDTTSKVTLADSLEKPEGGEETWLKPIDVAKYLNVSRSSVYQWIRAGRIPSKRIGPQIRINRHVLDLLIDTDSLIL